MAVNYKESKERTAYDAGRENQKLQRTGICRILY